MAEYVSYIANINPIYNNYLIVLAGEYGTTADRAIRDLFEQMALDLGPANALVKPLKRAIGEVEELYEISPHDRRPVLILTDVNPNELRKRKLQADEDAPEVQAVKLSIGTIADSEDKVRNFLMQLVQMVRSDDYRAVVWAQRKLKIEALLQKFKILGPVASIIRLGTSLLPGP